MRHEELGLVRLSLVLSDVSPLFALWGVRELTTDPWFAMFCVLGAVLPNAILWLRIRTARKQSDKRVVVIGTAKDRQGHLLVYLLVLLLFYTGTPLAALVFLVLLLGELGFVGVVFAMHGYHVFTVYSPDDKGQILGKAYCVLITRRAHLPAKEQVIAYRVNNLVCLETEEVTDNTNKKGTTCHSM